MKLILSVLIALGSHLAHAEPAGVRPVSPGGGLDAFFNLKDKLPGAVCDEAWVSKAPSFESVSDSSSKKQELDFSLALEMPESQLMRFLMGDATALAASNSIRQTISSAGVDSPEKLQELKRRVSLEFCTSLVTPGKLKELLAARPEKVLRASLVELDTSGEGKVLFRAKDIDHRFGKLSGKWWVPGWVEPFEVQEASTGKRTYLRLAHPVTNQLQAVVVMGSVQKGSDTETPLGYLTPGLEEPVSDWDTLITQAKTDTNQQKKVDIYRAMMELQAFPLLTRLPKRADDVRKLQEFYRNLINAYRLYPDGSQFDSYAKSAHEKWGEVEVKKVLDAKFFEALRSVRLSSGTRVSFVLFSPDVKLAAIYQEYSDRLEKIR